MAGSETKKGAAGGDPEIRRPRRETKSQSSRWRKPADLPGGGGPSEKAAAAAAVGEFDLSDQQRRRLVVQERT